MSALLEAAYQAAKLAQGHGADEAKVSVSRSRGVDIEWRDGKLERVQERTRRSLSAEIYADGRYSASSTSDLRPEALDVFLRDAVTMTKLLEPDVHRGLPDADRYQGRAEVDLQLADPTQQDMTSEQRLALAERLEHMVREKAGDLPIVSVATNVSDTHGQSARVHTNGFEGVREGTSFSFSAMVTVKDADDRRPMGWSYAAARHREDLDPPGIVAQEAREKARHQLGSTRLPTGRYTVVLDNRAVPRLLGAFMAPLSGPAIQQRRSLWEGRLGEQVASKLLTIYDEPHIVRGLGSSLWDGDGFATVRRPLITEGVIETFFINQYYARKMGVDPTGADTHNLAWTLGDKRQSQLIADVGEGVYIDRFLGGNSNSTSGEVSYGCAGRVIRNGELAEPVSEINLSGHFGQIWERLVAVGNDPNYNSSSRCPSCVFDDVQLSGA